MIKAETEYIHEESKLLQQVAEGSREAYAMLYQFFFPKLYQYIYGIIRSKEDAEEILQDIFLTLWEKKKELQNVRSFNAYIFRIARNKLINKFEHEKVQRKAFTYIIKHAEVSDAITEDHYIYRQYNEVVTHALNALPPKRRQVFEMSIQKEFSHNKIACELQISKSMVKKQLYAANRHIKKYLQQYAGLTPIITCMVSFLFNR
jgi:RNA polymerase sigma-70 factor (family 1)